MTFTVLVVLEVSDIYLTLTKEDIAKILDEKDLKKRDTLVHELGKPVAVYGSDDTDLSIVIDSQPAEERWGDVEEDWSEALYQAGEEK